VLILAKIETRIQEIIKIANPIKEGHPNLAISRIEIDMK
jgi:hypothetical protein